MPDIFRTADRFRRELLKRDRAATTEMVKRYGQIWKALKAEIEKLTKQYYAAAAAGEATSPTWLFQLGRLQSLQRQVEAELAAYARWAEASIRVEQWEAVQAAQRHAAAMIEVAYGKEVAEAINFQRLPTAALEDLIGFTQAGSPLFDLLAELGTSAAEAVKEGLITGLALGKSPRDTARGIRQALGGDLARALRIARTETMRSYRESTRRAYEANANVVEGWIWHCGLDNRTCAACWAMHGTEHPITEILDDHPNGRCAMLPKTKSLAELGKELGVDLSGIPETQVETEKGTDLFAQLDPAEQLKILGPAKFAAYQAGELKLPDLVGRTTSKEWGPHRYEKSLRAVLGEGSAKKWKDQAIQQAAFMRKAQRLGSADVLEVGKLPADIARSWSANEANRIIVLTGKQRAHYLTRHPDIAYLEAFLPEAVLRPDEVHRNKKDLQMAIFYKEMGPGSYLRVAVLMQLELGQLNHSILSFRKAGRSELQRAIENGRRVWKKE